MSALLLALSAACHRRTAPPSGPAEWVFDSFADPAQDDEVVRAIGGTSADDVWAVGFAIHHFDGKTWSSVPVVGERGTLSAISVVAKDDIWAAGLYGYVAHFDGKAWTGQRIDVARISANPAMVGWYDLLDVVAWPNEVWIAASRPNYFRFDGARWSPVSGAPFNIQSFWGTDPRDVWTPTGSMPTHFDGARWERAPAIGSTAARAVHGTAKGDVWMVGWDGPYKQNHGSIRHFDGAAWLPSKLPPDTPLLWGVHGAGRSEAYAVGNDGVALVFDGTGWRSSPTGMRGILKKVWAAPGGHAFAVGLIGNGVLRKTAPSR